MLVPVPGPGVPVGHYDPNSLVLCKRQQRRMLIVALPVVQPSVNVAHYNFHIWVKFYGRKCNVPGQPCLDVTATSPNLKILIGGSGICEAVA